MVAGCMVDTRQIYLRFLLRCCHGGWYHCSRFLFAARFSTHRCIYSTRQLNRGDLLQRQTRTERPTRQQWQNSKHVAKFKTLSETWRSIELTRLLTSYSSTSRSI